MLPATAPRAASRGRALLLAFVLVMLGLAPVSANIVATHVSVSVSGENTVVFVDLSEEIPVETVILAEPDRIVFDLPRVLFLAPQPKPNGRTGLVRTFRFGLFIADRSRIVLELAEPAIVQRIDFVRVEGGVRLVAQLQKVERRRFLDLALAHKARAKSEREAARSESPTPDARRSERPLVVIDPGHGGVDPGATGPGGESEKEIVLALGKRLKGVLEAGGRFDVAMTREDDSFVPLEARVRFARTRRAALMVSIHADSLSDEPGMRGASVYTLSERASDAAAAKAAEKENRADLTAGIDLPGEVSDSVGDILFDLARRETRQSSVGFARDLVGVLGRTTTTLKNPLRSAGFRVLTAPDVPAVLLELGYLSNPEETKRLVQPEWQQKVAEAVGKAIEAHLLRPAGANRQP